MSGVARARGAVIHPSGASPSPENWPCSGSGHQEGVLVQGERWHRTAAGTRGSRSGVRCRQGSAESLGSSRRTCQAPHFESGGTRLSPRVLSCGDTRPATRPAHLQISAISLRVPEDLPCRLAKATAQKIFEGFVGQPATPIPGESGACQEDERHTPLYPIGRNAKAGSLRYSPTIRRMSSGVFPASRSDRSDMSRSDLDSFRPFASTISR